MLRGTKKQIIHLKNPDSPLFEEAFLIVKNSPHTQSGARTMVEEANRLLAVQNREAISPPPPPARKRHLSWVALLCFLTGALTGISILLLCLF